MIAEISRPCAQNITHVKVFLPVRYGDEDIPFDFPLRIQDTWTATINIDSGKILDWPKGKSGSMHMKVCDSGVYALLDNGTEIATIEDYVPHGVIPGEYGDYVILEIDRDGIITNWPTEPDVEEFFAL